MSVSVLEKYLFFSNSRKQKNWVIWEVTFCYLVWNNVPVRGQGYRIRFKLGESTCRDLTRNKV